MISTKYSVARRTGLAGSRVVQSILLALCSTMVLPIALFAEVDAAPGRQLRNLHGFSKLYGYVRFFHPSDEAQQIDWDKFAVYGARRALNAPDVESLHKVLEELYGPLAPALRIYPTGEAAPPMPMTPSETDGLTAVAWQHRGPGLVPPINQDPDLWTSVRLGRGEALLDPPLLPTPEPGDEISDPFTEGLSFAMPIALWSDAEGTLPRGDADALADLQRRVDAVDLEAWDATNPGDRVALAVIGWNIIEHFYPYFPELGVVWEQQHIIALREQLEAVDAQGAYDALRRSLWAYIGDSQSRVAHPELDQGQGWLPIIFDQVDGYITIVASDVPDIKVGDDLETFGSERAGVTMQHEAALVSGTGQWRLAQALRNYGRGEAGSSVAIELYRRGNIHNLKAEAVRSESEPKSQYAHPPIAKLQDKIFYVDLRRAGMAEIRPRLKKLAAARGVIFDLRGELAEGAHELLSHLIDEPVTSADEELPLFTRPAEEDEDEGPDGWQRTTRWHFEPATPRIGAEGKRPTVLSFLADGNTVGEAEIFLDLVRHRELGEVVGWVTAGAAGTMHHFRLPGGFELSWTAARFRHKDETVHHLSGIEPDVWIYRTPEGVRAESDEVLEEAHVRLRAEHLRRRLGVEAPPAPSNPAEESSSPTEESSSPANPADASSAEDSSR